jgi:hypothetical protein
MRRPIFFGGDGKGLSFSGGGWLILGDVRRIAAKECKERKKNREWTRIQSEPRMDAKQKTEQPRMDSPLKKRSLVEPRSGEKFTVPRPRDAALG